MPGRFVALGLALCTIVAAGCGGSSSTTFSCNYAASSFCFDESVPSSLTGAQVTQLQNSCTGDGGTFANGSSCPTSNRVGTCTLPTNTTGISGLSYRERFYSPGFTASSAQMICTQQNGTWTAG